jgi:hypothetical protein
VTGVDPMLLLAAACLVSLHSQYDGRRMERQSRLVESDCDITTIVAAAMKGMHLNVDALERCCEEVPLCIIENTLTTNCAKVRLRHGTFWNSLFFECLQ